MVNITGTLTNPGGKFELTAHDGAFPVEAFDQEEAELFESQLNTLIANMDSSVLTQLINQRQETIARVATLAKAEIDGKTFGGINAGDNEIGFSVLRPGHILETGGSAIVTDSDDWYADPAGSTGWVDWIGDGTTNKTLTSGANEQLVLALAFVDQSSNQTEVSGINVDTFGRNMDMLPLDLNDAKLQDNENDLSVAPLPALVGQENDDVYIKLRFDRDVERQPRLFGFNFSLGSQLNTEDYNN